MNLQAEKDERLRQEKIRLKEEMDTKKKKVEMEMEKKRQEEEEEMEQRVKQREEHEKKIQMAEQQAMPLIVRDDYDLEDFLANVAAEPDKRCGYCYSSRLRAIAQAAAEGGFDAYTSSLLYSRYQKHDEIRASGELIGSEYGVEFYYRDFRSGWQEGIRLSKEMGLYRQQYCGCVYSEKERYMPTGKPA